MGALPPETARKQPGEPPKIDLQGVDGVDKLVRAPRQSPLQPHPYCAAAVARPSGAIGGPDRDQPHLLCLPTRAAWAALRGRTIISAVRRPRRPRAACISSAQLLTSHTHWRVELAAPGCPKDCMQYKGLGKYDCGIGVGAWLRDLGAASKGHASKPSLGTHTGWGHPGAARGSHRIGYAPRPHPWRLLAEMMAL